MAQRMFRLWIALALLALTSLFQWDVGFAAPEEPKGDELLKRLKVLEEMIQRQQEEIQQLKKRLAEEDRGPKKGIKEAKEEPKKDAEKVATEGERSIKDLLPKWIERIKVSGDLRLRYEGLFDLEDALGKPLPNRDQFRLRARLFFDGTITDELSTHFMLCTDQDSNREATTTNQTFTDDFNNKGIYLHRAYGMYRPKWLMGLELVGGKFKNSFLHTDIMWDPDVNPEGFYEKYSYKGFKNLIPFIQFGQMSLNELRDQTDDAWLFIEQLGIEYRHSAFDLTIAGSWYDWSNLKNTKYLNTAQYKTGGGNTFSMANAKPYTIYGYAYDYNLVELITYFTIKTLTYPLKFTVDYIHNTDPNVPNNQDTAYYLGFDLGKLSKKYDWLFGYKYARIEKDSLVGSMADQDFYGANRKGHKVYLYYKPVDRLRIGGAYFLTRPVTDWTAAEKSSIYKNYGEENRIQIDTIFEF